MTMTPTGALRSFVSRTTFWCRLQRAQLYPRVASSGVALQDTSPLPDLSPASAWRSSGSVGPVTPADRPVADWPTALTGMPPVAPVPLSATTSSSSGGLRSAPPLANGSSSACGSAPMASPVYPVVINPNCPERSYRETRLEEAARHQPVITLGTRWPSNPVLLLECSARLLPLATRQLRSALASARRPLRARSTRNPGMPPWRSRRRRQSPPR